jgi:hypothetical protein
MNRIAALIIAVILLLPTPGRAQTATGGGGSIFSGLGQLWGQSGCAGGGTPWVGPTTFYAGWAANSKPGTIGLTTKGLAPAEEWGSNLDFRLKGIWLGASQALHVGHGTQAFIEGWYLIPTVSRTDTLTDITGAPGERSFSASYQWWFLDGRLQQAITETSSVLAGFRYDLFQDHLTNPTAPIPGFSDRADQGDLSVGSLIPYVGVQAAYEGASQRLVVRAVGFPWIGGDCRYGLTFGDSSGPPFPYRDKLNGSAKKGMFGELFAEYSLRFCGGFGSGNFGVFARLTHIRGRFDSKFESIPVGLPAENAQFDVGFLRNAVTLGVNATISFPSPI